MASCPNTLNRADYPQINLEALDPEMHRQPGGELNWGPLHHLTSPALVWPHLVWPRLAWPGCPVCRTRNDDPEIHQA